jgi:AbrB family looped-hinge helix DNA binding protein
MSASVTGKESASRERHIRKVGARAQVTIPKEIVDYLQLKEGDQVSVVRERGHILIEPVKMVPKNALYYEVGKDDEFITADDINEAVVEAHEDYQSGKLKKYKNAQDMFTDNNWAVE